MMGRIHKHDMQCLNKGRIEGLRLGATQHFIDKRKEHRILDAACRQNVSTESGTACIILYGTANHLQFMPIGIKCGCDIALNNRAGIPVETLHQLVFDKPFFPVKPVIIIRQTPHHNGQIVGPASGRQPVKPRPHKRTCHRVCASRWDGFPGNNLEGERGNCP